MTQSDGHASDPCLQSDGQNFLTLLTDEAALPGSPKNVRLQLCAECGDGTGREVTYGLDSFLLAGGGGVLKALQTTKCPSWFSAVALNSLHSGSGEFSVWI